MSGIFGIVYLDGRPAGADDLNSMRAALAHWGPDGGGTCCMGCAGFGHALLCTTPESRHESMPVVDAASGTLVVAAARLDNRDDLCRTLDIPAPERAGIPDGRLVVRAYERWGEESPLHLLGDWSFAAWNSRLRRLFIARDHLGNTGLFYYHRPPLFAFASSVQAILALPETPRILDEQQLARYLVIFPGDDWSHTFWRDIFSLLPAHSMAVTPVKVDLRRYWRLEHSPVVRLGSQQEYLDGFLHHYRRAVHSRLRSSRPIGATLSSGLDSGSVTALAAEELQKEGRNLTAFTSVPVHSAQFLAPGAIADEWPLAHAVAARFENIEHIPLRAEDLTPIAAIRRYAGIFSGPIHAASNLFWIMDLFEKAKQIGLGVLLTGGLGNGGVSWSGGRDRIFFLFAQGRWGAGKKALTEWKARQGCAWPAALRHHLLRPLLKPLWSRSRRLFDSSGPPWGEYSAIHPDFARRQRLREAMNESGHDPAFAKAIGPLDERLLTLNLNGAAAGPLWHAFGAAFGVEIRDPTADIPLLEYCMGVPDEVHTFGGGERMMIRMAMDGILPDEVRWNTLRGRQAADVALRLLLKPEEVENELYCMSNYPMIKEYLDCRAMRRVWEEFLAERTVQTAQRAAGLLLRGIMAGRFLISAFTAGSKEK